MYIYIMYIYIFTYYTHSLAKVLSSSSSEMMAANLMKGLLGALQHLHKQEIIYRKLSPENIFLTTDRGPRVG
jgi:serine/threonine protein kinase